MKLCRSPDAAVDMSPEAALTVVVIEVSMVFDFVAFKRTLSSCFEFAS
jgi:hypothetical protein